jgi:hypothetical protein
VTGDNRAINELDSLAHSNPDSLLLKRQQVTLPLDQNVTSSKSQMDGDISVTRGPINSGAEKAKHEDDRRSFDDSGYGGSAERDTSSITNSRLEHIPEQAEVSNQVSEARIEGEISPAPENQTLEKEQASPEDTEDLRSVLSIDFDIASQISTRPTHTERLAEQHLGNLLAQNDELRPLFEKALAKISKHRFIANIRRLLKHYYLDLRPICESKLEIATVRLLKSRWSRERLSKQVADIIAPENEEEPERFTRDVESRALDLERSLMRRFLDFPLLDLDKESETRDQDQYDPCSESGSEESEPEEEKQADLWPTVSEMENFLLTCGGGSPFQKFSTALRLFLFPPALGTLTRTLMSIPKDQIWFDEKNDNSFSNKFKSVVEDLTEDNWNWWPLRPRMHSLGKDQLRLHWICVS